MAFGFQSVRSTDVEDGEFINFWSLRHGKKKNVLDLFGTEKGFISNTYGASL